MITFSELGRHGRLGNQLFQLGLLISVGNKCGYDIFLPDNLNDRAHHGQKCLLKYFKLPSVKFGTISTNRTYHEKALYKYDEDVFKVDDYTNFFGHFENINYYKDIRNLLQKEFEVRDPITSKVTDIINKHSNPVVSLHVRRGDNTDGTNPGSSAILNDTRENSVLINYYRQALKEIPSNSTIYLFTGGARNQLTPSGREFRNEHDYDWCKKFFDDDRIIFAEDFNTIETFCFFTRCNYNIMSFASTFCWWGAFLNKNNNVIAPKQYHPVQKYPTKDDIYLDNWLNL